MKILDLFSGLQSVKKALEKDSEIDYKGIDIYDPDENYKNIKLDLTQDDIIEYVKNLLGNWKPDVIWASPVCNKFSIATTGPGGNTYFIVENGNIRPRKKEEYIHVKHNKFNLKPERWDEFANEANLALKMYDNMKKIIEYYKVPFFIENPKNALSKYILKEYIKNFTNYCMWDDSFSKKPTTIYSNRKFDLEKCNHSKHENNLEYMKKPKGVKQYAYRSRVPKKLIKKLFKELEINE